MALTGMQIYKSLPRTNCKDCGLPTCMAFAMQVASKQRALTDCPHLDETAKDSLSEASAPPMRLVKIGPPENTFEFGQETVMFRHEEKFHRNCGLAVRLPSALSDAEAARRVERIKNIVFERVGKYLKIALCAVELDGIPDPVARIRLVTQKTNMPLILISENPAVLENCLKIEELKSARPLLYKADEKNIEACAELAARYSVPLVVTAAALEILADLTKQAAAKGAADLVLGFQTDNVKDTLKRITLARRAALKKNFRALGYPAIVEIKAQSAYDETVLASLFAAKYAGIIILDNLEPWEVVPVLTLIEDVYTDPQVPNMVEAKLYKIGEPDENSPVLFTTNFSLTYFSLAGEVERSKVPAFISVVETEGLGVLNAYAGDKISVEKIVKTLDDQQVKGLVKHNKLIIPGLLPFYRAEIEDTSEWKEVLIGPETAREVPGFLSRVWK
ncbi:MAG: acetyl-CoA decarbonylase/synthase complex subunit gamma [Spirochaetales bacterium]|nr:acetyl-CoA decarbonylase/synthase complex subunit gamma [Spirochaetales bacterium]